MNKQFQIKDFIATWDGKLEPKVCEKLIEIFKAEESTRSYTRREEGAPANLKNDLSMSFYKTDLWYEENEKVNKALMECLDEYIKHTDFLAWSNCLDLHFTHVKMQKTIPGTGYHLWHVERNYKESCRRALVYTVYLNDVEEGGETEFLFQKLRVPPKTGRISIFPADFPYVHRGNPPLQGEKYILTSWFNF